MQLDPGGSPNQLGGRRAKTDVRVDLSLLPNTGGTTPDPTRPKPLISGGYGSLLVTFFKRFGRVGSLLVPPMAPGRYHGGGGRLLVATGGTQSDPMAPKALISRASGSLLVAFLKRFGRPWVTFGRDRRDPK